MKDERLLTDEKSEAVTRLAELTKAAHDAQADQEAQMIAAARAGVSMREISRVAVRSQKYVMDMLHADGLVSRTRYERKDADA